MKNEQNAEVQDMPFWLACLVSFAVMVVIVCWIIFGQLVLNLHNPWVGLVALATFGAAYNSNLADAPKVWIGSAVALLIAYALWYIPTIPGVGPAGGFVGLVIIILCLGAFIAKKFSLVCNYGMLIMLTVATASEQIRKEQQQLMYLLDLAYGAICFWIIPLAVAKIKEKKAAKQSDYSAQISS